MEILNVTQAAFAMTKQKRMAEIIKTIQEGPGRSQFTIGGMHVDVSTSGTNYVYTVMDVVVDSEGTKHFTPVALGSDVMQIVVYIIRRKL